MSGLVLLVEDNPSDEKLTRLAFKKCGVENEMIVVHDGVEALEYFFGRQGEDPVAPSSVPAVVLLDIGLPRIGGLEVLQRLRADERTRVVPIVILTSSGELEDVVRSYALGANAYVRKPVDFAELVKAATAVGLFWLQLNVRPYRR